MMDLNDEQGAKFWPIYREYDTELQKLNDKKLAGIQGYAKNYDSMTDEKADELAESPSSRSPTALKWMSTSLASASAVPRWT